MRRPRVAFVIQRYGPEVLGGAESLCRAIARQLVLRWDIEVLTTCAQDVATWKNALPPGETKIDGGTVRRFPVDRPRDVRRFNRQCDRIVGAFHTPEDERRWMELQGPHSQALLDYLEQHGREYSGFVLFNYLYATTYESLGLVAGRFYLVPFAHNEPWIYLRLFEDVFRAPRGIVFCTEEEREFVCRRFPFALPRHEVIGTGIDLPDAANAERFRSKFGIREPFMLYAGRIDESKACHELFDGFKAYRAQAGSGDGALSLVLCGHRQLTIPSRDDIHYVGFVSEQDKRDALAAAAFLVLPSHFESLSIVLLEAWATRTPVLVNGHCEVSVGQCRRSGGGLWYKHEDEFVLFADCLARDEALRTRLGESGRTFVCRHYHWPKVVERYAEFIRFGQG